MTGRIFYKNLLRTLEADSHHVGWAVTGTQGLTDEDPRSQSVATGYAGTDYELIYDLGVARTGSAVAVINHNMSALGYTLFLVSTGSADNGTIWDEAVLTSPSLQTHPGLEPAFAQAFATNYTRRYWRFQFWTSSLTTTDELKVGQLCLFNDSKAMAVAPAAPRQFRAHDTAGISRGIGGYENRTGVGPGGWDRQARWLRTPGGTNIHTQVRDALRYARECSSWGREPVAWTAHDDDAGDPLGHCRPCSYCVMDRLDDGEVLYDGTIRRYDVNLTLRELTYNGLL